MKRKRKYLNRKQRSGTLPETMKNRQYARKLSSAAVEKAQLKAMRDAQWGSLAVT